MSALNNFFVAILVCLFLNWGNTSKAFATAFKFTKIADTNDALFNNFGFYPAINNQGTVVLSNNLDADGKATSIFIGNGETLTNIANTNPDSPFSLFSNPTINDAGLVSFKASLKTGGIAIVTSSDSGAANNIIASSDNFNVLGDPAINNKGTVAFSGTLKTGDSSIFVNSEEETSTTADIKGLSFFDKPTINDTGTVAFSASPDTGGRVMYKVSNKNAIVIADTGRSSPYNFLFNPTINNAGTIVFKGVLKEMAREGIFTVNDEGIKTIAIADIGDSSPYSFFQDTAINNNGNVAFWAALDAGGFGIFTGANPVTDKVIAAGDPLFSSTVKNLFFSNKGINDRNQLAFYAELTDGTKGIFRAELQPDPLVSVVEPTSMLGLLAVGALGSVFLHKK